MKDDIESIEIEDLKTLKSNALNVNEDIESIRF